MTAIVCSELTMHTLSSLNFTDPVAVKLSFGSARATPDSQRGERPIGVLLSRRDYELALSLLVHTFAFFVASACWLTP